MTKVKARIEGHYEVREIPYGKDYVWMPGHALIECDCGRMMVADLHTTVCPDCGTDHETYVRGVIAGAGGEFPHPWHVEYEAWRRQRGAHHEREEWREQRDLD